MKDIKAEGKDIKAEVKEQPRYLLGAHVSAAGRPSAAVENAASIGATAFALFVKNQRRWQSPDLKEEDVRDFKEACTRLNFPPEAILPHGSYLVNLGCPDEDLRKKSFDGFVDELRRCNELGLKYLNIHPGSSRGEVAVDECCSTIAQSINAAHKVVPNVTVVLENTAGGGSTIGRTFEELRMIIDSIEDQDRIAVCLDTCHLFASGYDLRTKESFSRVMDTFEKQIGLKYLRGMHLNDSKTPFDSKKDRHEFLGKGSIGLDCFRFIMNDSRFLNIPLILETPGENDVWRDEIKLLHSFSGSPAS